MRKECSSTECRVIVLGNIYGYVDSNYAGNVYDDTGISPTLTVMSGGNRQPMIIVCYECESDKIYE